MSRIEIRRADADETAAYGRRRFPDAASRALYGGDRVYVACDEGTPIGICIARDTRDERVVTELFVEPSFGASGIGADLLAATLEDADDRTRSALLPSREPALAVLFAEHGIAEIAPVRRVAGPIPKDDDLLALAAGDYRFGTQPIDPDRHAAALAQLDRETRGGERDAHHRLLACLDGAGLAFSLGEELAGYAYLHPAGFIGPFAAASPAYVPQLLAFAMATLRREYGTTWCSTLIPGANVRAMRAALRAGLRMEESYAFASDGRLLDPSRYLGMHPLLF